MTIAHWCFPFGELPEALEEVTARVPAATATPTAVSFRNSRRLMLFSLIVFLTVVLEGTVVPALQPGSQHHAPGEAEQTCQGRESHGTDRRRLGRHRVKL